MREALAVDLEGREVHRVVTKLPLVAEHFDPAIYLTETAGHDCDYGKLLRTDNLPVEVEGRIHIDVLRAGELLFAHGILVGHLNEEATALREKHAELHHILGGRFVRIDHLKIFGVEHRALELVICCLRVRHRLSHRVLDVAELVLLGLVDQQLGVLADLSAVVELEADL